MMIYKYDESGVHIYSTAGHKLKDTDITRPESLSVGEWEIHASNIVNELNKYLFGSILNDIF